MRHIIWSVSRNLASLLIVLSLVAGPAITRHALAAVPQDPSDPVADQLRDKYNDIVNAPVDFCDPAALHDHLMAVMKAGGAFYVHQWTSHHHGPDDLKHAEDRVVQEVKDDGALVEDLPYVADYQKAERRGDVEAQDAYFKMMTPPAQAQAAQHDGNFDLVIKIATPLAEAGDTSEQLRLAGMYSTATTAFSAKYPPVPDAKMLKVFKAAGMKWPIPEPPENLPLAFKYYRLAAAKGDFWGQSGLARAYACGFGTPKNPILAYMWFSAALAQRGVTPDMAGVSLPMKGHQKDYALNRDFLAAQMKPEEIEQAKQKLNRCSTSGYRDCD